MLNIYKNIFILNNSYIFNIDRQYYGKDMLKFLCKVNTKNFNMTSP